LWIVGHRPSAEATLEKDNKAERPESEAETGDIAATGGPRRGLDQTSCNPAENCAKSDRYRRKLALDEKDVAGIANGHPRVRLGRVVSEDSFMITDQGLAQPPKDQCENEERSKTGRGQPDGNC
jgi:hypothetical protein